LSTELWIVVLGCAVVTALIKGFGPVTIGGRELPSWSAGVIGLMAPALLAALVVVSALTDGKSLAVGPQTAGVAAAGIALWRGANVLVGVVVAVAVTAAVRALA
jgi:branched-subunit amino acid transport protein